MMLLSGFYVKEVVLMNKSTLAALEEASESWGCKITDKLDFYNHAAQYRMFKYGFYAFAFLFVLFLFLMVA